MSRKIVITCAVTGHSDTKDKNPAVPITPAEIARASIDAARAGAAVAHIHVRDPATGKASTETAYYKEAHDRIRDAGSDVIVNLTTGPGGGFRPGDEDPRIGDPNTGFALPERRVVHVEEIRPEICTLDVATLSMGEEHVFINTPKHLRVMAGRIRAVGVKPELECFDVGHVRLANHLVESGDIALPPMYQLCLGIPWGAPATPEVMMTMRDMLPPGAHWAGFGISRHEFPMVAAAVLLGGHVRVGLEDNLYLEHGVLAPSNAALVEKAVRIVRELGFEVATPDEAREILHLAPRPARAAAE